jgi:hypothetical protein
MNKAMTRVAKEKNIKDKTLTHVKKRLEILTFG